MLGLSKPVLYIVAIVLVLALLAFAVWLGIHDVRSMINDAATKATAAADAKWTAQIEKSNAEANERIADQATAALKIQSDLTDSVNAASQQLEELRKRNAALPHGGDIGLDADHVQLLPD